MCLAPKPKITKVEAPAVPPPPVETAERIANPAPRQSADIAAKRRGVRSLMVERQVSGINSTNPAVGLKL